MDRQTRQIGAPVEIGRVNENNAREIAFDVARWMRLWPGTTPKMLIRRKGDKEEYPAKTVLDGTKLIWSIDRYDTKTAGDGAMWVVFIDKTRDIVGETPKTPLRVLEGPNMIDPDTPEAELPGWTIAALDAAERAEAAAERAEAVGGVDPEVIKEAVDEYLTENPIDGITQEELEQEVRGQLQAAKDSGEFKGDPGEDGKDGTDGKDGYTPQKGVDYFDGKDGAPGEKGDKGDKGDTGETGADGNDGKDGEPGYTPQRGTDYWTAADRQQMVSDVLAALPTWEGGAY